MSKVSKIPLHRQTKQELINAFWYALGKLNRKEIEILLKDLLSPTEIIMLSKRLEILKQLIQKFRYTTIKQNIKVTEPTIAKMSFLLQRADDPFHRLLKELIADEEKRWKQLTESRKPR